MEIGGGTGIHAFHFLQSYSKSIASFTINDLSEKMLKVAKKRLVPFKNLITYHCGATEEIATNKTYNGIFISGSMHHFSDPETAIFYLFFCRLNGRLATSIFTKNIISVSYKGSDNLQ